MGSVLPILSEEEKEKMALNNAKIREELEAMKKNEKRISSSFCKGGQPMIIEKRNGCLLSIITLLVGVILSLVINFGIATLLIFAFDFFANTNFFTFENVGILGIVLFVVRLIL